MPHQGRFGVERRNAEADPRPAAAGRVQDAVQLSANRPITYRAWLGWLLPALVGTLLSMARTGQVAGRWNNFFHLPILAGLPAMPQFADDAFVQALTGYASGFWQLFAGRVPLEWIPAFLLFWAVVSRFLTVLALLACADLAGVRSLRERLAFVVLIAFSAITYSYASAGGGGLFINYFSHSELANAPIAFSIWLTARRRYAGAVAMTGVTCFLNAFMAVWALAPMAAIALWQWRRGEATWTSIIGRGLLGAPVFLLLSIPAIRALLAFRGAGHTPSFDYVRFLTEYFPIHSIIWEQKPGSLIMLAVVTAVGLLSAWTLARRDEGATPILMALIGFCLLWLLGALLPLFTVAPALLNLQLLRSSVGIHLMSGLSLAALSVTWLRDEGSRRRIWVPLMVLGASLSRFLLPVSFVAMLFGRRRADLGRWRLDGVVVLLLAISWPVQIVLQARFNTELSYQNGQWRELGEWARTHSRPDDIFMLPLSTLINETGPLKAPRDQQDMEGGAETFQTAAERRVWVDFRAGAAVMWRPGYYPLWKRRVTEVLALDSHERRLAYAQAHGIAYLIDRCGGTGQVAFALRHRCIYRIEPGIQLATQLSKPYRWT